MNTHQSFSPYYENVEFTLTDGQSDYDLDSNQIAFLNHFGGSKTPRKYPTYLEVRTNFTITIKLNSASNDSITITSTDTPYVIAGVEITNVYLSNASGSSAAVKLRFQDSPY